MPKGKKQRTILLAFVALLVGSVGLIINFIVDQVWLNGLIQFFFFLVAAIVSFDIVKDGKSFFTSFYKMSYTISVIVAIVFIFLPFILKVVDLLKS